MLNVAEIKKLFSEVLRETNSLDAAFSKAMFAAYTAGLKEDANFVACGGATFIKQKEVHK